MGAAWSSIELTIQYLKNRVAFGKPLADFQVIKNLINPFVSLFIHFTVPTVQTSRNGNRPCCLTSYGP